MTIRIGTLPSLIIAALCIVVAIVARQPVFAAIGVCIPFAAVALRSPISRRFAFRNIVRRPRETLLIIVGSLLGTAIITSAAVVGASMGASMRQTAFTEYGPVDEIVSFASPVYGFPSSALAAVPTAGVDGKLAIQSASAAFAVDTPKPLATSDGQVIEADFSQAAAFGGDAKATGIKGQTPAAGHAVVSQEVADALHVKAGSTFETYIFGQKIPLTVDAVLTQRGLVGLPKTDEYSGTTSTKNIFIAPGTLAGLQKTTADPDNAEIHQYVLVSNTGGVLAGAKTSETVSASLKDAMEPFSGHINQAKFDVLKQAKTVGLAFTGLFDGIGSFSIAAGILLLINIFWMLAQERQTELGILRALGMQQKAMIGAFGVEGTSYAVLAAAAGTFAGAIIARVMISATSHIFKSAADISISFSASPAGLLQGFSGGLIVSIITVFIASLLVARMNVIAAIRDLPYVANARQRWMGAMVSLGMAGFGALLFLIGLTQTNGLPLLIGPTFLALGCTWFARRLPMSRMVATVSAAGLVVWVNAASSLVPHSFQRLNAFSFIIEGLVTVVTSVMLLSLHHDRLGILVRLFGRGPRALAIRLGLSYPVARPGRTGMLVAMYAMVTFIVSISLVVGHVVSTQIDREVADAARGGDISVRATSGAVLPIDAISKQPGVAQVSQQQKINLSFTVGNADSETTVDGIDANIVGDGAPSFIALDPTYVKSSDAWQAVATSTKFAVAQAGLVVGDGTTEHSVKVGDVVHIQNADDPNTGTDVTVIALTSYNADDSLPIYVSIGTLNGLISKNDPVDSNELFVKVKSGVDVEALAAQLSGLYVNQDIDIQSFRDKVASGNEQISQIMRLLQGYLAIGLVAGIAGLAVVMVRAVRERRRQIGILRAIGFPASDVRWSFLIESTFIAFEGTMVGVLSGLVVCWRMLGSHTLHAGIEFQLPWGDLALLMFAVLAFSTLATLTPAQQASRIRPAIALRTND